MTYLEKEYSSIILQTKNDIPVVFFVVAIIIYLTLTWPKIKKLFADDKNNQTGFIITALISLLLTLLNFIPLLLINHFPFNKSHFESHEVLLKNKRRIQEGGAAPYSALFTTSWRNLPAETFRSNDYHFKGFNKGDVLTIKLSRDLFKRIRIVAIEKSVKP